MQNMRIPAGFQGIAHALRTPQFALYTTGNSVSMIGNWMQKVAVAWLAWELTKSGAWLGLIAFADLFPTAIIAPFAGAAADRWERLRVLRAAQVMAFAQSMTLLVLLVTDQLTIWPLFVLTVLLGATQAFEQPARLALIPSLVPAADLTPAIALNSITFNIARFVGPAISGLLIVSSGVALVLVINALTYVVYFYALMRVRPFSIRERAPVSTRFFSEVADGFRYAIHHPGIGPILLLMVIVSMGGRPVGELLPAFADDMFETGAIGLAVLTSSLGVGSIMAGLWLASRPSARGLTSVILATSLVLSLAVVGFIASKSAYLAVPLIALGGACMSAGGIAVQTLILTSVENRLQGRVVSLIGMILRGGPALGALIMGFLSVHMGLRTPILLGAIAVALAWLWAFLRRKRITEAVEDGLQGKS